jgi:uncharacterized repeat protein (TIGR01451 family)
LTVTKAISPSANVPYRSPVTFDIHLGNTGDEDATGVLLTDSLPLHTTFDNWLTPPPSGTVASGDQITWSGSVSAGKAITFTFEVSQNADYGQAVVNTAEYSHTTGSGKATASFTVEPSSTLAIYKAVTPEKDVPYHSPVTYTVVVTNTGPYDKTDVTLSDQLPGDTAFDRWVSQPGGALVSDNKITWFGTIGAGKTVTFTFVASQTADYGQEITNRADVSTDLSTDWASASFTVEQRTGLTVDKEVTPNKDVRYGSPVNYRIVVGNARPTDAIGVIVTDTLHPDTTFDHWTQQVPGVAVSGNQITWTGTISANADITLAFVAQQQASPGQTVTNVAGYRDGTNSGTAEASFTVASVPKWRTYLPLILRLKRTGEGVVLPEPPDTCPCGWFDSLGRMLDFAPGDFVDD